MRNFFDRHETEEDILRRKQANCEHNKWVKTCSCCHAILDSDHIHEEGEQEEIII